MNRYKIEGPKYNPSSALTYKIWDEEAQDYLKATNHGWNQESLWDQEFSSIEEAEAEIKERKWMTKHRIEVDDFAGG